jgi:CheY-like chemotaxis protein
MAGTHSRAHTILVVEDDADLREVLCEILSEEGYGVVTAAHGEEALRKLRDPELPRPSMILLDLMMPVMSGAEFWTEQQRDPSLATIPVLMLSADRRVNDKAPPAFTGECLPKPIEIDAMLHAVSRYCSAAAG